MDRLTPTQRDTLARAALGLTNEEIAAAVYRGETTIEDRMSEVYRRLGVKGTANPRVVACVAFAVEARDDDR
jgi:DNA-binding NarL/FixJ family response regulator